MSEPYTQAKRQIDEAAFDGWVLTSGTPPGRTSGVMLCMIDRSGRVYACGVGETELESCNALAADMQRRSRQWIKMLLLVRNCRKAMRIEAGELREERSKEFLADREAK